MEPTKTDLSLYVAFRRGELIGINGTYVDDLMRTGTHEFMEKSRKRKRRIETSSDDATPFTFAGFTVSNPRDGSLTMDQAFYLEKIECLESGCSFSEFRSTRMRVARLANTRPDMLFEISELAQVRKIASN